MLVAFGQLLKEARIAKKLSQDEVAEAIKRAQGQYSDIERAYTRPGQRRGSVPDDDFLASVSSVLGIPLRDLHAALGRIPPGSPAVHLVREKLAEYNGESQIAAEELAELSSDVADYAKMRVEKTVRQAIQPAPTNVGQPENVSHQEMMDQATRLTRETRARDPRVRRSESVVWALDTDGRFLMSEGAGLEQVQLRFGQAVGLRIWDVYQGEDEFLEKVRLVLASDAPLEWTTTVRGIGWRCMTEPLRDALGVKVGIVGTSLALQTAAKGAKTGTDAPGSGAR